VLNKLKPKSEFSRNVLTLMTGTTIAQAIPIAISPILTRIYTPEDFGVFALFFALTMIFGSIVNGRYELAIMLPSEDEDAINIAALGIIIAAVISTVLFVIILFFSQEIMHLLNNENIHHWLYLLPISVFLIGLFNVLNYFNTRMKYYKDLSKALIYKSLVLTVIQLSVGFIYQGAAGLISGLIISNFFGNMKLSKNIIQNKKLISSLSIIKMKTLAKRYINFPKFSMWSALASTSSQHLTSILISSFFSIATLGFYSLSEKVLGVPSTLIGRSIGQVYFQQASKEKQETGTSIVAFKSTIIKLLAIGLPFFGILFFIIEDLFSIVFGESWRTAGQYAQILLPLFLTRFIVSPLTLTAIIYEKNILDLLFQICLLIIIVFLITVSKEIDIFLTLVTYIISCYYIIYLLIMYTLAKKEEVKV